MTEATLAVGGTALTFFTVLVKTVRDWKRGERRDRAHGAHLDERFVTLDLSLEQRFNGVTAQIGEVRADVAEVRAFCVGPDGENGFRGDLREVKARVIGLEDRERDHARLHGPYVQGKRS